MSTLKEIAKICGVSASTVSRAFDPTTHISDKTRNKIIKIAKEMNYSPNLFARGLKTDRTYTIGIIIPSIENRFYIDALKYIEIYFRRLGYRLIVCFMQYGITDEKDCLISLSSYNVDGLIFSPRNRKNEDILKEISKKTKIIQLFTASYEEYDSVLIDDINGTKKAVLYLLSKGHREILVLTGDERAEGYRQAFKEYGLPVFEPFLEKTYYDGKDYSYITSIFNKYTKISAIISVATQTEAVLLALRDLKKKIPRDISVISFDDANYLKILNISAVAHNLEEIAGSISERLNFLLTEKDENIKTEKKVLQPILVLRQSVNDVK